MFPRGRQGRVSADTVASLSQIFPRAGVLAWMPDPQCPALRRKATNYNSFSVIAADPQQALLDVCGTSRLGRQGLAAGPGPGAAAGDDGAEWPAGRHDAQPPEHGRGGENGRVAGRPRTSYTSCHDIEPLRPPVCPHLPPAASFSKKDAVALCLSKRSFSLQASPKMERTGQQGDRAVAQTRMPSRAARTQSQGEKTRRRRSRGEAESSQAGAKARTPTRLATLGELREPSAPRCRCS